MSRLPRSNWPSAQPPRRSRPSYQPPRRRERWRLRWGLILGLPLIGLAGWAVIRFFSHFIGDESWEDILDQLNIANHAAFTRMFQLGLVLVGIVIIMRILRGSRRDD